MIVPWYYDEPSSLSLSNRFCQYDNLSELLRPSRNYIFSLSFIQKRKNSCEFLHCLHHSIKTNFTSCTWLDKKNSNSYIDIHACMQNVDVDVDVNVVIKRRVRIMYFMDGRFRLTWGSITLLTVLMSPCANCQCVFDFDLGPSLTSYHSQWKRTYDSPLCFSNPLFQLKRLSANGMYEESV